MYGRIYLKYMVVPCLTCSQMATHEYTYDKERDFYNYHITCKLGIVLPDPMPKEGFSCDKYENKLASMPRAVRSQCTIELEQK